ncbi:MAG: thymidine phosphorylase [Devosiaceae bacterium]|nr:thymidine phosphorylase [Devosiaceae bacterium MH13]
MGALPQELIAKKRDGGTLAAEEIGQLVTGMTDGSVTDAQISAFAMAVFFRGMAMDERVALTLAMRDSGDVLDWSHLDGPALDKHSTGGVGDNLSLMLAPIVAACGGFVPMISGRGLGHTGGTLDKMDSIPGYQTQPDNETFRSVTESCGCAVIGQTAALAPADKRFYGIRDVTATVESIDLITASILSKKLAAGLDGLVLDVKSGSGAFMPTHEDSEALASSLVSVANGAGTRTSALLTDMNEVLGHVAGNAVEVATAVEFLTGAAQDARVREVTLALCAQMLVLGGLADKDTALAKVSDALDSGRAAERFAAMVTALGGPAHFVERYQTYLAVPEIEIAVPAPTSGTVAVMDTRQIGLAVVALGGGRTNPADPIDHAVGLTHIVSLGDRVEAGDPLARVLARTQADADAAASRVTAAITIGDAPAPAPAIYSQIDPTGAP